MNISKDLEEQPQLRLPYESPQVEVVKVKVEEGFMTSNIVIKYDTNNEIGGNYEESKEVDLYGSYTKTDDSE